MEVEKGVENDILGRDDRVFPFSLYMYLYVSTNFNR